MNARRRPEPWSPSESKKSITYIYHQIFAERLRRLAVRARANGAPGLGAADEAAADAIEKALRLLAESERGAVLKRRKT